MNFDNQGIPIAIVKGGDYDKLKKNPILSLSDKETEDSLNDIQVDDDYSFQLIPNTKKEREILYVVGQSGSGKSYFCTQYLKQYKI